MFLDFFLLEETQLRGARVQFDELSSSDVGLWRNLQKQYCEFESPFTTHEFAHATHKARGEISVLVVEADQNAKTYVPFQSMQNRSCLGVAEKVGGHMSDYFDIVGPSRQEIGGARFLKLAKLDAFRFDHLPADLESFCTVDLVESTGMEVSIANYPQYLSELSLTQSKFLSGVRRAERQIRADNGELHFAFSADATAMELDKLIGEKRRQYRSSNAADVLEPAWTRKLLHGLFEEPLTELRPTISTLYAGKSWLSSCLSLGYRSKLHIWFPAYNPEFRRFSPGHILFLKMFEYATQQGYSRFDFGEGASDYKRKYLAKDYTLRQGAIRRRSPLGLVDRVSQAIEWRLSR